MYRIELNYRINAVKWTIFPILNLWDNAICDAADSLCRDAVAKLFFQDVAYLSCAVIDGIQAYNTVSK